MKRDVTNFMSKYLVCQQVKAKHQLPVDLLKPIFVPIWKCKCITCDFVLELPKSLRKNYCIWVLVHRLTKSVHFIPVKATRTLNNLLNYKWAI